MTVINIDITLTLGSFTLEARCASDGRSIALFGPSGSGKTTLAHAIAGLVTPQSGHIAINGTVLFDSARGIALSPRARQIGYVFQDTRLFPHMTVKTNLVYGQWWSKSTPSANRFDEMVTLLDIGHLLGRKPDSLSGGEQQRVAIGRALLMNPRILLFDEPLASLDQARKAEIIHYLLKIRKASSEAAIAPMIMISHAPDEVNQLADAVILIDKGKVKGQIATPMPA